MHVHAFSPMEIMYGARRTSMDYPSYIGMLRDAGLGSIPGTAAEILDDEVREILSHKKVDVRTWIEIITTAHRLGVPTTSTVMYGHVETAGHVARHIELLRDIQKETGGFTEFVPLGFIWENTQLYHDGKVTPQPKGLRDLRIYAVEPAHAARRDRQPADVVGEARAPAGAAHAARRLQRLRRHAHGGEHLARGRRRRRRVHVGRGDRGARARRWAAGRSSARRSTGASGADGAHDADHGAGGWRGGSPVPPGPLATH